MALTADSAFPPPPPQPPLEIGGQRIDWGLRDVIEGIAWFVGLFVAGQIALIPAIVATSDKSDATYATAFVTGALVEVAIAFVALRLTFMRYGGGLERLGLKPPGWETLGWAAAAFVTAFIVSVIYGIIIDLFNLDFLKTKCAEQIPSGVRDERALLAMASVVVIVFAPICEELFFRGFMFPGIARKWGVPAGIVLSGVLFGGAHLIPKSFIPIAGAGMVFAFAYWRSGNIFSNMLAHLAFNSVSIAFIAGGSCDQSVAPSLPALLHPLAAAIHLVPL
jgi:membrane protease YdiL (CAAX protease family)